jgi:glyoxylase-like metal-dependent hydrolase (beta-lactamase superfamily II)
VTRLTAPNPSLFTGPGTNTYLIGRSELLVVDPGPDIPAHLDALAAFGAGRIRRILVTHTHPDHAPGAAGLAARTGAPVLGFDSRDGFSPDQLIRDGEVVSAGEVDFALRALHTPGHASNHVCWLLESQGLLFAGDHVMEGSTVVISPPDGDMGQYLASLERVRALEPPLVGIAPGHGALIDDPAPLLGWYIEHRRERETKVIAALRAAGRAAPADLVPEVYAEVSPVLHPAACLSLWAHLRKLGDEGRARSVAPQEISALWEWRG